jgi:predicted methyltransferase
MRQGKNSATALIIAIMLGGFATTGYADHHGGSHSSLEALATGAHRSAANILRNAERHPVETLEFFGLEANMTVIEILPSTGWYTEIIAPYVRDQGKFYAAHFSPNASLSYMAPNLRNFEAKMSSDPALYGKVTVRHLNPPHEIVIAPAESADMALTCTTGSWPISSMNFLRLSLQHSSQGVFSE